MSKKDTLLKASIILSLAVSFYFYEYLVQVAPSVMTTVLMRDFNLTAVSISTMAAFFYYGYSPMQLPGGLLYDRFGPRKILTIFMAFCVLGAYLFSRANGFALASFARLLMGVGGAVSFVGPLVLASRWFPQRYFSLIAGIVQLVGSLGAVFGQVLVAQFVNHFGWRQAMFSASAFGVVLLILIALIVRDYPDGKVQQKPKAFRHHELKNLMQILKNSQTWVIALYSIFIWMPITVFAAFWGVKFLSEKLSVTIAVASMMMAALWVGNAIGSVWIGWRSEKRQRRRQPLALSAFVGIASSLILLYIPIATWLAPVLLFLLGAGSSGQALSFAVVRDINSSKMVGTAMGFNNFSVVASGAIGLPLVGWILHLNWHGELVDSVRYYGVDDFQHALFIIPLSFLVCLGLTKFLLKESISTKGA